MQVDIFQIKFVWESKQREVLIRTAATAEKDPPISLYEVYRNNTHLFSVYPVLDSDCKKKWEVLEKERESHIPKGFLSALGYMIDGYYVRN